MSIFVLIVAKPSFCDHVKIGGDGEIKVSTYHAIVNVLILDTCIFLLVNKR